jgi:hypothetical protein
MIERKEYHDKNAVAPNTILLHENEFDVLHDLVSSYTKNSDHYDKSKQEFHGSHVIIIVNGHVEFDYYVDTEKHNQDPPLRRKQDDAI